MKTDDVILLSNSNIPEYKNKLTENIFQRQKLRIAELITKRPIVNKSNELIINQKLIKFNNPDKTLIDEWESSKFQLDVDFLNDLVLIEKKFNFYDSALLYDSKGVDLAGLIVKSKESIDYETSLIDLKINFSLKGESCLWIFLRYGESFDEYTSIIRVYKEDKSKKIFIQFGAFIQNESSKKINEIESNLHFCIFSTQQLIEITKNSNRYNLENDVYDIQLNISDQGDNIIATSTRINNNSYENLVRGHIFLPFFRKGKVLIGGEGQEVLIRDINGKIKIRDNNLYSNGDLLNSSFFTNEKRNCECCYIF